jgi:hypothetical protein
MPASRAEIQAAIEKALKGAANYGGGGTMVRVGPYSSSRLLAATRAAQEAIPELERRGFKASVEQVSTGQGTGTEVRIYISWR